MQFNSWKQPNQFQKFLCRIGVHTWQDAKWYRSGDSCALGQLCARCLCIRWKTTWYPHDWTEWCQDFFGCQQQRACTRCGETERQSVHLWGEWRSFDPCCSVRGCERCGNKEYTSAHVWSPWTWNTADDSDVRVCLRCNYREFLPQPDLAPASQAVSECQHQWTTFVYDDTTTVSECVLCGTTTYAKG